MNNGTFPARNENGLASLFYGGNMTELQRVTESLRAAVDVGNLGVIAEGVAALEGLTGLRQTHGDESDVATISSGHNDAGRVLK